MRNEEALAVTRPDITSAITRGVMRMFMDFGDAPISEFRLVNSRRADIASIDRHGKLTLIEVKSCRADFEADDKWRDYLEFCDHFYFAVSPDFPLDILPHNEGLIVADAFGGSILRHATSRQMAAARRKATTIRFARQAAYRQCLD